MACNANWEPFRGSPVEIRAIATNPAKPARVLEITKHKTFVRAVGIPVRYEASSFEPVAYTWRPNRVYRITKAAITTTMRKYQIGVCTPNTLALPNHSNRSLAGTGELFEIRKAIDANKLVPPRVRMNGGIFNPATKIPQRSPNRAQIRRTKTTAHNSDPPSLILVAPMTPANAASVATDRSN